MKKLLAFVSVFCVGLLLVPATMIAGDKKGSNQQDAPKDAQDNATVKAARDLQTAALLLQFGRREKHPESMLVAAQILHRTPSQKLDVKVVGSEVKDPKTLPDQDNSPKAIVAEAAKLSSAPHVVALAEATNKIIAEGSRGVIGGPRSGSHIVQSGQTFRWDPIHYRANEKAVFYIDNGITARMLLEVYDENGNRVAVDNVPGSYYRCEWFPRWDGPFYVRLTNYEPVPYRVNATTN